jgi:hypothetical protein
MQRFSIASRSCRSVGTTVMAFGVRAAVGGTFPACAAVRAAVVAFGFEPPSAGPSPPALPSAPPSWPSGFEPPSAGPSPPPPDVVMSSSLSAMMILSIFVATVSSAGCRSRVQAVLPRRALAKQVSPSQLAHSAR